MYKAPAPGGAGAAPNTNSLQGSTPLEHICRQGTCLCRAGRVIDCRYVCYEETRKAEHSDAEPYGTDSRRVLFNGVHRPVTGSGLAICPAARSTPGCSSPSCRRESGRESTNAAKKARAKSRPGPVLRSGTDQRLFVAQVSVSCAVLRRDVVVVLPVRMPSPSLSLCHPEVVPRSVSSSPPRNWMPDPSSGGR